MAIRSVEGALRHVGQLMHHQPDDEIQPLAGIHGQGDKGEIGADRAEQDTEGLQKHVAKLGVCRHVGVHHQQVDEIVVHASQPDAAMRHRQHADKCEGHDEQGCYDHATGPRHDEEMGENRCADAAGRACDHPSHLHAGIRECRKDRGHDGCAHDHVGAELPAGRNPHKTGRCDGTHRPQCCITSAYPVSMPGHGPFRYGADCGCRPLCSLPERDHGPEESGALWKIGFKLRGHFIQACGEIVLIVMCHQRFACFRLARRPCVEQEFGQCRKKAADIAGFPACTE
ncbi:hypothetical protein D3C80_1125290 [compost metagenome]